MYSGRLKTKDLHISVHLGITVHPQILAPRDRTEYVHSYNMFMMCRDVGRYHMLEGQTVPSATGMSEALLLTFQDIGGGARAPVPPLVPTALICVY